jgi:hypothetical protein
LNLDIGFLSFAERLNASAQQFNTNFHSSFHFSEVWMWLLAVARIELVPWPVELLLRVPFVALHQTTI